MHRAKLVAATILPLAVACSSPKTQVRGHVYLVGASAAAKSVDGTVTAIGARGTVTVGAQPNSGYSLLLPPGSYRIAARSPEYDGNLECRPKDGPRAVRVRGKSMTIDLYCATI